MAVTHNQETGIINNTDLCNDWTPAESLYNPAIWYSNATHLFSQYFDAEGDFDDPQEMQIADTLVIWINNNVGAFTQAPTSNPTYVPTIIPTAYPSFEPTKLPSYQPTKPPSYQPTQLPSYSPTKNPSAYPTDVITIVEINDTSYQIVNENDIQFSSIEIDGESDANGDFYFNPGYRSVLSSNIVLNLDTLEKLALFRLLHKSADGTNEVRSGQLNLKQTITWLVYDTNSGELVLNTSADESNDVLTEYNEAALWVNSNGTFGNYTIQTDLVIYSNNVVNSFSNSICQDADNFQEYFSFGTEYTFISEITFELIYQNFSVSTTRSTSIDLTTNSPPRNGSCTLISPENGDGTVLYDAFNFSCSGWIGNDISNVSINYLFDNNIFLSTEYSTDDTVWIATLLPIGNYSLSAVVLDDLLLPYCIDFNVTVSYNNVNLTKIYDEYSFDNFADWLIDVLNDLIDTGVISSNFDDLFNRRRRMSGNNNNTDITSLAMTEEIIISLLESFMIVNDLVDNTTSIEAASKVYEAILVAYLSNVEANELSAAEVNVYVSALESLTTSILEDTIETDATVTYSYQVVTEAVNSLSESVEALISSLNGSALDTATTGVILGM